MNPNDLRVIKTKRALSESLFHLLSEKLFSTITVNMICDNALVHRTTFYKHFYDKYDLLSYLITNLTKEYFEKDISDRIEAPFKSLSSFFDKPIEKIDIKQRHDQQFMETVTAIFIQKLRQDIIDNAEIIEVPGNPPIEVVARVFESAISAIGNWKYDEHKICADYSEAIGDPDALDRMYNQLLNIKVKSK
ncbi:TetR/AcrR family transcriptional regulator [Staphylococcus simulans]|uniref:TetR/AcrR family transcriptional regulator n=1 Tax=Staphylococcus simulans TaxID=1286 RepID=UPI00399BF1C5